MESVVDGGVRGTGFYSLDELKVFLGTASPEQVSRLAPETLPDNIPQELIDEAPEELRRHLEELVMELGAFQLRQRHEIEERFGPEVGPALDQASRKSDSPQFLAFKGQLKRLVEIYKFNRNRPVAEQEDAYRSTMEALNALEDAVKEEMGIMARGAAVLKVFLPKADQHSARFKRDIDRLEQQFERYQHAINVYDHIRMSLVAQQMQVVKAGMNSLDGKARIVQVQINAAREELKHLQSKFRLSAQEKERERGLKLRVGALMEELKSHEVVISETDLVRWLDVIVEASISDYVRKKAGQTIHSTRLLLFTLLQKYCALQEMAAREVARNPFSQADPKQTIQFMLKSEQFILDYFSRKKSAMVAWLGGAAEKRIGELGELEKDLLTEMKKNSKKLK